MQTRLKHTRLSKITLFILLGCFTLKSKAGIEPVLKKVRTGTAIGVDSILELRDYYSVNNKLDSFHLYRATNRLRLEINHDNISECLSSTFSICVRAQITKTDAAGDSTKDTVNLCVNYNTLTGSFLTDAATYDFENSYETRVKILNIDSSAYRPFVKLTLEMEIERYRDIDMVNEPTLDTISIDHTTGDLVVRWNTVLGAEEYDLEWLYQDNITATQGGSALTNIPIDFNDNATGVTIKENQYRISNIFDKGYFVCRVRAVTKAGHHFVHRIEGPWSNQDFDSNLLASGTNYQLYEDYIEIEGTDVHEDSLNWQLITTFAEQGLKKEVITYMDGLFRGRQTVTRNNTDTMAIVGDFYYDHQNRQTIAVLPVPAFDKIIKYHKNFNKVKDKDTILRPRDYLVDASFCTLPNPRLDSTSGAGKYYSSANPLISNSGNTGYGNNQYIPHAFGYAYTKTEYFSDPTNRVRRQGGVGSTHQIGGGHETQYIYATAFSEELDPLFGNDVGFSEHYQKQMVIDPNGQVSISYTNLAGKTIATALAGDNTPVTTALNSLNTETVTYNLLSNNDSLYSDYALIASREYPVEKAGYHYFDYKVNAGRVENGCTDNLCYDCIYDLTISVSDECGTEYLDADPETEGLQPLVVHIGKPLSELDVACEGGTVGFDFNTKTDDIPDSIAIYLPVGKYTVEKRLAVNLEAARMYADSMIKYDTCIKTKEDYAKDILGDMDTWGCKVNCETCNTELGSLGHFMQKEKWRIYKDSGFTVLIGDSSYYKNVYQAKKDICAEMCTEYGACDGIWQMLYMDVSEGGQYGDDPAIKDTVSKHPEYCHYAHCIDEKYGRLYDAAMMSVSTYEEAEAAGYLNPLNNAGISYTMGTIDPYFRSTDGMGYSSKSAMTSYLNHVPENSGTPNGLSAWQIAVYATIGNHLTDSVQIRTFVNANPMGGADCSDMNDLMWLTFRAIYIQKKLLLYQANEQACDTVTIPEGKQRIFLNPSQNKSFLSSGHDNDQDIFDDEMKDVCDSNCLYQVQNWLDEMGDCDFGGDAIKDTVIKAMVKVCKYGCNDANPFGSSSVDRSKYATAKYRTFGDVFRIWGIHVSGVCDTNLLQNLLPFNQTNHFMQNDTSCCNCDFDSCTNSLKNAKYKKIIKYTFKQKRDTACRECKECDEIGKGVQAFNKVYPGIAVFQNHHFPELFQKYMNQFFRFNLSYQEYMDFMEECLGVKDSIYNDSIIYRQFLETYYPYQLINPTGYAVLDLNKTKKREPIIQKQPEWQYASVNASATGYASAADKISSCHCDHIFTAAKSMYPTQYGEFSDDQINDVMNSLSGCVFKNPLFVFKTCFAAASTDTAFVIPDIALPITWNDDQNGFLTDEILEDTDGDSLSIEDNSGCDCPPVTPPSRPSNWSGSWGNSSYGSSQPYTHTPCDSVEWWVNMYLDRSGLGRGITMGDVMEMSWNEKKKLSKYLDSIYIKKGYMTGVTYNSMTAMDSSAVEFHILRLLDQYFRCIDKPQPKAKPKRTGCGDCYQDGKNANLLLNYLRQMTGRDKYANYLTKNPIRLMPPQIKSYYETDLYKYGTHPDKLTHGRASGPYMTHYREFQVVDDIGHDFKIYLAFLDPQNKYNFGSILSFFDLQVIKDSCNGGKSSGFIVKAILKGTYPKLDTTLLYGSVDYINLLSPCTPSLCNREINEINYTPDSCMKSYHNLAEHYASLIHDRYIDSLKQDFYNQYIAKCKHHARITEEFTATFQRSVYHYTLYYYDQLGNLIQTVPPAGVVLLTGTALDSVKAARELPNRTPYYPSHTLITRYKYNTLNQLVWQSTPDAGASNFWYDRLGRLVSSQNSQQYSTTSAMPNKRYSYTLYDSLGRIKEVGELTNTTAMSTTLAYDYSGFATWVGSGGRTQITRTYYDRVKFGEGRTGFNQENLRSRVATITVQQAEDTAYDEAVHYSYDIHGNVKSMVRENKQLIAFAHHLKKMEYDYDLISGKVNKVIYQKNKVDQFIHSYTYDAENRIQTANTSTDNVHYETDARYTYYKHGPLARTEIGRLYVQGVDYIYTLQGWLKGVNSTSLYTGRDPGHDGYTTGVNHYVSADEYGFSLRYFKNDFRPIRLSMNDSNYFDIKQTTAFADATPEMFNGNISNMVTGIQQLSQPTLGRAFKYDQLNRIKEALSFTAPNYTTNQWGSSQPSDSAWYESFSYDANGNITKLKRKGNSSSHYMMDNFAYNYQSGTNKLTSVDDQVSSSNYTIDIDDQSSNNYKYDYIGNLTVDIAEGIDSIQWNVYGKIKSITRTDPFYEDSLKANLNFTYTPDGHRSTKGVSIYQQETEYTYYVRDAQGNVMATYEMNNGKLLDSSQLTKANINTNLISTSTVQTFADFMIDEMDMDQWLGLVSAYRGHVVSSGKTEDVLLGFNPVPFIVYNTAIQTNVLAYYTPTTILQSISNYQIFSTFYANIMPTVCTDAQIVSLFEGFIGMNTLLANWNPMTVVAMGNAYRTWCIGMAYPVTPLPCATLGDVQTLAGMQTAGVFSTYISGATTYHTALKNAIDNAMTDSDIIQQMAGGINIRTIINSVFSTTVIFTALRDNGLATLWGYIIDETIPVTDALDYYKTYDSTEFVKQCIIVLPSFINSYLPGSVSAYLQHIRNYYTTEQYSELIAALTELYFTPTQTLQLAEWHIYGSRRIGIYRANKPLAIVVDSTITAYTYETSIKYRYNGKRQYELSNHLLNVLVTISDRRMAICNDEDSTLKYEAVVTTANDYAIFGSPLIGRTYERDTNKLYPYSVNGQQKEDEIYGKGNATSAEFWEYDGRLGRRWNKDQTVKVHESPYACFANNPIWFSDPNGNDTLVMKMGKGEEYDCSYGTAIIYPITFSIIENGIERTITTSHTFHMISNLKADKEDKDDAELTKQTCYALTYEPSPYPMPRHDGVDENGVPNGEVPYGEACRVGTGIMGVFIHRWQTINGWLQGCKGLTTNLQTNPVKGPFTSENESINASNLVKALYNSHKGNLTGTKFLLKAAPKYSPIDIQSKGFGGFNQSTPSSGTQPLTQLASPQIKRPTMNRMQRTLSKIRIFVGKATGN